MLTLKSTNFYGIKSIQYQSGLVWNKLQKETNHEQIMYVYVYVYIWYVCICTCNLDTVLSNPFIANVPIIFPWGQQEQNLWFSGILRECGVAAFARNGSITDKVHGMSGFLWITSLDNANNSAGFLRICMGFLRTSVVETPIFYKLLTYKWSLYII